MQKIEDTVADVLDAMRKRRIGDYSIKCINWSVYRPIINWHHECGAEVRSFRTAGELVCSPAKEVYTFAACLALTQTGRFSTY